MYNLIEREDFWVLDIHNIVTGCRIGSGFDLQIFNGENPLLISMGGIFTLHRGDNAQSFHPEEYTTLGPSLSVIGKVVESAIAYKNGHLEVKFLDGSLLTAEPDPQYESWHIFGDTEPRMTIVCGIGGQLHIWY
ncbi:MAG: hypothetical protein KY445_02665 [Armatimonadetes bacterium]|nr:hypothetical protein [Armatimonadota bacterium]